MTLYSRCDLRVQVSCKPQITKRRTLAVINYPCQVTPKAIVVGIFCVCVLYYSSFSLGVICGSRTVIKVHTILWCLLSFSRTDLVFPISGSPINHDFVLSVTPEICSQSHFSLAMGIDFPLLTTHGTQVS